MSWSLDQKLIIISPISLHKFFFFFFANIINIDFTFTQSISPAGVDFLFCFHFQFIVCDLTKKKARLC